LRVGFDEVCKPTGILEDDSFVAFIKIELDQFHFLKPTSLLTLPAVSTLILYGNLVLRCFHKSTLIAHRCFYDSMSINRLNESTNPKGYIENSVILMARKVADA
jgi:hypothetical protein